MGTQKGQRGSSGPRGVAKRETGSRQEEQPEQRLGGVGLQEGEAGVQEGEAGALEGEAGVQEGEAGAQEGEAREWEGEAGAQEGEAGVREGEAGAREGEAGPLEGEARAQGLAEACSAHPHLALAPRLLLGEASLIAQVRVLPGLRGTQCPQTIRAS